MKTRFAKKDEVERKWYVVDAADQVLGRLATRIAVYLRGKHKPQFTPNVDAGDFVIVVNAEKVKLTGNKLEDKVYYHHTGYPGGQRTQTPEDLLSKKPTAVVEKAVKGMLPKSRLGSEMFRNLFVYAEATHPHEAQQPKELDLNKIK